MYLVAAQRESAYYHFAAARCACATHAKTPRRSTPAMSDLMCGPLACFQTMMRRFLVIAGPRRAFSRWYAHQPHFFCDRS